MTASPTSRWPFDNTYARLPDRFHQRQGPEPAPEPKLIRVNRPLASSLGLDPDWLESPAGVDVVAGNTVPEGADPIATVYAGHQFGGWNPQLGDGRALLLGEVVNPLGERFDIQLKGSGRTRFSRAGDGKAPLGPVLREYIVSEAMAALGVPTTRALAAVTTGSPVLRTERLPGAVLARVAKSHVRVGTFEYFASQDDREALKLLADHVIDRHYPELRQSEAPYPALLQAVIARQADLIARWQTIGFIHGVMNTDNMLVSGETIDYGPCAFMDYFHPRQVYSSIDHQGRYAYGNQPGIAHWNLARFAQALLPLLHDDHERAVAVAQAAINEFPDQLLANLGRGMRRKLGLEDSRDDDESLIEDLLTLMTEGRLDFTLTFRRLAELACPESFEDHVASLVDFDSAMGPWLERWRARLGEDSASVEERAEMMRYANPAFIPRNHVVESALRAAIERADFEPFHRMVDVLAEPFDYRAEHEVFAKPPAPGEEVQQTFCGT